MRGAVLVRRGAAGLGVAAVLALLLHSWWLAPLASHLLSSSAGRPVHFDSAWVTLSGGLEPVIEARGIRIENAPWADARRPLAALASVTAVMSWRSVREYRPVVSLLTLRDGELDLERKADGLRNWRLVRPEDRGPGRYKVLAIRGENATVRFLHELIDLDLEATTRPNSDGATDATGGDAMPTRLDVRGTWRSVPFVMAATTSEVLTFVETGRAFRIRGQVSAGGARLDLDGHFGDVIRDPLVDARVALVAPSLAPFAAVLGGQRSGTRPIALEGTAKGEPGRYALTLTKGRLGATDLAGELSWTRGEERNLVKATLTSASATLADLRSLSSRRAAKAVVQATAPASAAAAALARASASASASAPIDPPARVHPTDADVSFAARRLHGEGMPWLQGARVDASLVDGRLDVRHFDVGVGQGHAVGKASLDTASVPPRGDVDVEVSAIRVESFLPPKAAKALLSGTLRGRAALKASGDTAAALLASATGTVNAFVADGTISSLLDAKMGLQGGRIVRGLLTGAEPIALRCAVAQVELDRGTARIRSLVVDTERTRTTGSGTIDLANEAFDVVVTPEAKQSGLFILDRSIRLHGPLREPKHELVARVAPGSAPARGCRPERP